MVPLYETESAFSDIPSSSSVPSPPIPPFIIVIMSSLSASSRSDVLSPGVLEGLRHNTGAGGVAGHAEDTVPPPEPGSVTASSGGGDGEVVVGGGMSSTAVSVWDFEHVEKTGTNRVSGGWKCLWCNHSFKGWNATKVLAHLTQTRKKDIAICRAAIDASSTEIYREMFAEKEANKSDASSRAINLDEMVDEGQQSMMVMYEAGRKRKSKVGGSCNTKQSTIESSTASHLTMAIADYIHSTGLSFSACQGPQFQNILKLARGVTSSYVPPSRNAIATTLLQINYDRFIQR
jgi:hypothetical protein